MLYRLLEVPFNHRFYVSKLLTAILSPELISKVYTIRSDNNTASKKEPLPDMIFNCIVMVARTKLKGTTMSMDFFLTALRHRFSSWKLNKGGKKVIPSIYFIFNSPMTL